MASWKLFLYLTPFWEPTLDNVIFERETSRPPIWRGAAGWIPRVASALVLLVVVMNLAASKLNNPVIFCLNNTTCLLFPLVLVTPSLLLWALPLGLTLAPTIVRERELHTWDTLLLTPLDINLILLSKAGGAMWWLRDMMYTMRVVLLVTSWVVGVMSLVLLESSAPLPDLSSATVCGMAIVLMLVSAGLFLLDRAQQFVLMVVAALAASTSASTTRMALPGASVAALGAWLFDVSLALLVASILPGPAVRFMEFRAIVLAVVGPLGVYLTELSFVQAALAIAGTFTLREIAVRALWRWTVRAARSV
jgi:hypothetical protein